MATRTLSVVFTDIKGFTERTSSSSRAALHALLDRHEQLLLPVIEHYEGTVVKTIGDAFLLTFESPTNAVLCGLMIQETLSDANARTRESERIEVRVAINTGEVEVRGNDVFGETVNIAARIEGITEPGEVYFTHATYLSMNKAEVPTSEVGERRLKGIEEPIRVYRVIRDENLERYQSLIAAEREVQRSEAVPPAASTRRALSGLRARFAIGVLIVLVAAGALLGPGWYGHYEAMAEIDGIEKALEKVKTRDEESAFFERLNDLADEHADDDELLHRVALINGAHPYWRRYAFDQIESLVGRDPRFAADEALSKIMFESLGYLDPNEHDPQSRDVRLRRFMADVYAERWRDVLVEMVHVPGAGERIDRRNAYLVLGNSGQREMLDEFRYFTMELWADVRSNDPWNARMLEFLEEYLADNGGPPRDLRLPDERAPKHLGYFNEETDRIVPLVSGLYADALKNVLLEAAVGEDTGQRLHGYQILQARGWLDPNLIRAHHQANLDDYWAGYTSGWVVDALRYFAGQAPATVPDTVRAKIETIAEETAAIIDSGKLPDARQSMDDYRERLNVANDALQALGKSTSQISRAGSGG